MLDWVDVEMELCAWGREDLAQFVYDAIHENKTTSADIINAQIVNCLFRYIDRMNDACDEDPADTILREFVADVMPFINDRTDMRMKCIRNISE